MNRWHQTIDLLPTQGQLVLVWRRETLGDTLGPWGMAIATYAIERAEGPEFPMWHIAGEGSTRHVSHWQPLPPAP